MTSVKWFEWLFDIVKKKKKRGGARPGLLDIFSAKGPLVFMIKFHLQRIFYSFIE